MRFLRLGGLLAVVVTAALAVGGAASGRSSGVASLAGTAGPHGLASAKAGSIRFSDPAGDAGTNAPDIGDVTVSNSDYGVIEWDISITNEARFYVGDELFILIDLDGNASTGAPNTLGAEYEIYANDVATELRQWNGSSFARIAEPQWLDQRGTTSHIFKVAVPYQVNGKLPNKAFAFNFWIGTAYTDSDGNTTFDVAPDGASTVYPYTAKITPDFDKDGKRGPDDKCPRLSGPKSKIGCPPRLPLPNYTARWALTSRTATFSSFRVTNVPPGAVLVVRWAGRSFRRVGSGQVGPLLNRTLRAGTQITLIFARSGTVGSFKTLRLSPLPRVVRAGCTRLGSSATVSCRSLGLS